MVYEKVFELFLLSELFVDLEVPVLITLFSFYSYFLWLGFVKVEKLLFWAQRVLSVEEQRIKDPNSKKLSPKHLSILLCISLISYLSPSYLRYNNICQFHSWWFNRAYSSLVNKSVLARLRTCGKCKAKQWKEVSSFINLSVALDTHKVCLHQILHLQYLQVWVALVKLCVTQLRLFFNLFSVYFDGIKKNEWSTVLWVVQDTVFMFIFPFLSFCCFQKIWLQRLTFFGFLFNVICMLFP